MAVLLCTVMSLPSCDAVYEDLEPCPQGLRLRFVYDYNMEYANAFPSQVNCLTLLVYDKAGKYVDSFQASSSQTSDENWRMEIDLPAGDYSLIAYGGMNCPDASFRFVENPASVTMQSLEVELPSSMITSPEGTNLHPLFFGSLDVNVPGDDTDYTDATVRMMKDTNNLRIILQNVDGSAVNNQDFTFNVLADNMLFNWQNDVIPTTPALFYPWTQGTETAGTLDDENPVQVGYAEFSLSRLMASATTRLEIKRISDGQPVLSIPLVKYLMLLKSEQFDQMSPQEFLDRESRWDMIFFLDSDRKWISTTIVINGWVVRINNIENFD